MEKNEELIPIRELERITGFKRSTIHHYVREGLLPAPQKSAQNMAYYDQAFVERLKVIKVMRDEHKLTLSQIKNAFQAKSYGVDAEIMTQIRNNMLHKIAVNHDSSPVNWGDFLSQTELNEEEVEGFKKYLLLLFALPQNDDTGDKNEVLLHPESVVAGKLIKGLIKLGIPISTFKQVFKQLQKIIEIETESFIMNVLKPMYENNESQEKQIDSIRMSAEFTNSLLSISHQHLLNRPILSSEKWINLVNEIGDK